MPRASHHPALLPLPRGRRHRRPRSPWAHGLRRPRPRCNRPAHQRLLRPHPRALRGLQPAVFPALGRVARRPDGRRHPVARRLGQAGARGGQRPQRRRRDPCAGGRHRLARERGPRPARLGGPPAQGLRALHLHDRLPRAQGQPQGHPRLGRPRGRRRGRHHAQPQDEWRCALELPRRLGLRKQALRRQRAAGQGLRGAPLPERARARLGRARLHHHLRGERPGRRARRLGERSQPVASRPPGRLRDRDAVALDSGAAPGGRGGRGGRPPRHARAGHRVPELPLRAGGPAHRGREPLPAHRRDRACRVRRQLPAA